MKKKGVLFLKTIDNQYIAYLKFMSFLYKKALILRGYERLLSIIKKETLTLKQPLSIQQTKYMKRILHYF
jgi:hypothetical protein